MNDCEGNSSGCDLKPFGNDLLNLKLVKDVLIGQIYFLVPLNILPILLFVFFSALYEKAEIKAPEDKKKHLLIGVSSDRGLCGAIHTSIAKTLKNEITNLSNAGKEVMVVGVGDKIRGLLQR